MNLILIEPEELEGNTARVTGARARHIHDVLRAEPGAAIRLGIVDGPMGQAVVLRSTADAVELRCELSDGLPPAPGVDLLLAVPRPKVMKRLWAQLAALGVGRVLLTNASRVERDYFDTHVLTPASWRPLLLEGLQQARDTRLPIVTVHRRFRPFVEDDLDALCPGSARVVAHPAAREQIREAVRAHAGMRTLLAIGPEGGWNDFELQLLESRGFVAVGMGPRTLRTDTACVALLSLVHDARRTCAPG